MTTKGKQIALSLIFLVVFDLSVYLLVEDPSASQWISVAFIHIAYAVLLFSVGSVPSGKDGAVLGYPGVALAWQYFVLEFILGLLFLIIGTASVAWTLIPQMVLAGVYAAIMISNSLVNEKIVSDTAQDAGHIDYVRQTLAAIQRIRLDASAAALSTRLDSVEDSLRYAQVTSDSSVAGLEAETLRLLDTLLIAVRRSDVSAADEACAQIERTVALRNTALTARSRN